MLPGFRFLFAAILLSTSLLVFGLGAAALLRAAHEEFASNPSWRTGPQEQVFARQDPREAVLATLQVEPPAARPETPEQVIPATPPEAAAPAAQEPEQAVVVTPETTVQPESPNLEVAAVSQSTVGPPQQLSITPPAPEAAAPAIAPEPAATPASEATLDAVQEAVAAVLVGVPVASTAAPEEKKQGADGAIPGNADSAAVKTAALGDAAVAIRQEPQAQEKSAVKPRVPRRKRHRVAQRPPAPPPVQPIFDPFAQQQAAPMARQNQLRSQAAR